MPAPKRGLALLLVLVALPGCGGSDDGADTRPKGTVGEDQREILETIDALQRASRRGDGRTICGKLFTRELARFDRERIAQKLFGGGTKAPVSAGHVYLCRASH